MSSGNSRQKQIHEIDLQILGSPLSGIYERQLIKMLIALVLINGRCRNSSPVGELLSFGMLHIGKYKMDLV
jgi:hypothetical protein